MAVCVSYLAPTPAGEFQDALSPSALRQAGEGGIPLGSGDRDRDREERSSHKQQRQVMTKLPSKWVCLTTPQGKHQSHVQTEGTRGPGSFKSHWLCLGAPALLSR